MRPESKLATLLLGLTTAAAAASALVYLNAGLAAALYAFVFFALLTMVMGSIVLRKLLARNHQRTAGDVKRAALHRFVQRYNEAEAALRRAARVIGQSRDRLPPLLPALEGLKAWVRENDNGPDAIVLSGKSLKGLSLTAIQKQRTILDRLLGMADGSLREAANQLRSDVEPKLGQLAKAGLGEIAQLPAPAATGMQDLTAITQAIAASVEATSQALESKIAESTSDYQPNAEAKDLYGQAVEALRNEDPLRALDLALQCVEHIAGNVKTEFHASLKQALTIAKAAKDEDIHSHLEPALAGRVDAAVADITALRDAPLRGADLQARVQTLTGLMAEILADLHARVADQVKGGHADVPATQPTKWKAAAKKLVGLQDAANKARKARATYLKVKQDIGELLATTGKVTAKAVGLKEASSIFELYAQEHDNAKLVDGALVLKEVPS